MDKRKKLLLIVLTFVVVIGGAYVLYTKLGEKVAADQLNVEDTQTSEKQEAEEQKKEQKEAEQQDVMAPDFTVYDAEGNAVQLSAFIGKPIVLNFWASWCGPCQHEMPDFHEKYLELGGEVQFLMVNMTDGSRETQESASAFIAEQGYTFPVFYDIDSDAAATYGAYSLPTTYFIDAEGHAIAQAKGAIDAETLQKGIDTILN